MDFSNSIYSKKDSEQGDCEVWRSFDKKTLDFSEKETKITTARHYIAAKTSGIDRNFEATRKTTSNRLHIKQALSWLEIFLKHQGQKARSYYTTAFQFRNTKHPGTHSKLTNFICF